MGRSPGRQSRQMPGIVLDPGAETGLPQHFNVIIGPLGDPLRFQQLVLALKIPHPFVASSSSISIVAAFIILSIGTT